MDILAIIKKHNLSFCIILSIILSFISYLFLFGPVSLNSAYTEWIFAQNNDLPQHYLGWSYFRNSSWMFPWGMYDSLSYPIKTSIMNTDSIPLFAIFFKALSPILPKNFQYFGLWHLLCLVLQGIIGTLIVKKYTKNDIYGYIISILSGLLFILLPFHIMRAFRHSPVFAQWLILLCFIPFVYSNEITVRQKIIIFAVTGILSGAINPYIFAICGLIILIYSIYEIVVKKKFFPVIYFLVFNLMLLFVLYIIGAFHQNSYYYNTSLFDNSFNLNGFFNSMGACRFFSLKYIDNNHQIEGFAYLGAGVLFLIFIAFCNFLINLKNIKITEYLIKYKKEITVILLLVIISIILAMSPRVTLGDKILFQIPISNLVFKIWSVFRATGRFIWITDYIILIAILVYLIKNIHPQKVLVLLIISILIQTADITPIIDEKHIPSLGKIYEDTLDKYDTPVFNKLASKENGIKYIIWDKFFYIQAGKLDITPSFLEIARWAKDKNIKLSYFYFARDLIGTDKNYFQQLTNPTKDEVFIFWDYRFFSAATKNIPVKYYLYKYNDLIFARSVPITGWEELEIKTPKPSNNKIDNKNR